MPYKELRRAYDFHLAINDSTDDALITYPRRKIRALDFDKYPINRLAMEDLENMYIYMLSDLNTIAQKADFQSGLSITNSAAHAHLDFTNVGSWQGAANVSVNLWGDRDAREGQAESAERDGIRRRRRRDN